MCEALIILNTAWQGAFADGVLWLDFRNKLDEDGLLLRERLQDMLNDLTPAGTEPDTATAPAVPATARAATTATAKAATVATATAAAAGPDVASLERAVAGRLHGKSFLIVLDNVHAHGQGPTQAALPIAFFVSPSIA